jgi:hypothetical protein
MVKVTLAAVVILMAGAGQVIFRMPASSEFYYTGSPSSASGCTVANLQTAIDNIANRGIVECPAGGGSVTWSTTTITVPSTKGILIRGNGWTVSMNNHTGLEVSQSTTDSTMIKDFVFTTTNQLNGKADLKCSGSTSSAVCRITENTFNSSAAQTHIETNGNSPVLIDDNSFSNTGGAAELIHNMGLGAGNTGGWTNDVTPGSATMVFVEDNTFSKSGSDCEGATAIQNYYGARVVFRYNTLTMLQVDVHGTAGQVGGRWFEIYSNEFITVSSTCDKFIGIRAGSGVIYDNIRTGTATSFEVVRFEEEDNGTWPIAFQPGSGYNGHTDAHASCDGGTRNQSPIYMWNNDTLVGYGDDLSGNDDVDTPRDYIDSGPGASQPANMARMQLSTDTCSTTYTYAPYAYPHPAIAALTAEN